MGTQKEGKITIANYREMIPKLGEINVTNGGSSLYTSALVVEIIEQLLVEKDKEKQAYFKKGFKFAQMDIKRRQQGYKDTDEQFMNEMNEELNSPITNN